MADSAIESFEAHAPGYNALRRALIPEYDHFYGTAVDALGLFGNDPRRVLDLGAGTGLLSAHIADRFPLARFVLLDGARTMLQQARELLGDRIEAIVVGEFAEPLPPGPFDAIASSLAIHHVPDEAKADLYARALRELRPGGIFVNAEHVAAATPELDAEHMAWQEARAKAAGATDADWAAALERFEHDIRSPVRPQLDWLADAGFEHVDCLFQNRSLAVIVGRRPAG